MKPTPKGCMLPPSEVQHATHDIAFGSKGFSRCSYPIGKSDPIGNRLPEQPTPIRKG